MNEILIKTTYKLVFKVTCIIPIYNGSKYLRDAINSIICQTLNFNENIQIILVNDGSTDNTEEICIEYVNKYTNNIIYTHSCKSYKNKGVSTARNVGLRYASGEYVSFLDSDDLLDSNYYATAINYLSYKNSNNDVDLTVFPIDYFDTSGVINTSALSYRFSDSRIVYINKDYDFIQFGICNTVIRRSALNELYFNEELHYSEDAEFAHRLILKLKKYYIIKEPSYKYRKHSFDNIYLGNSFDYNLSSMQKRLTKIDWYKKFNIFGELLIKSSIDLYGEVIEYTQYLLVHELMSGAISRIPDLIIDKINIDNIFNSIYKSLLYVSDAVILSIKHVNKWYKYYFLSLKYKNIFIKDDSDLPAFYVGNCLFEKLDLSLIIHKIYVLHEELHILCSYNLPQYEGITYICESDDKREIKSYVIDYYINDMFYLGKLIHQTKGITIIISLKEIQNTKILFFVEYGINKYPVNLMFTDSVTYLRNSIYTYILRKSIKIEKGENCNELNIIFNNSIMQKYYFYDMIDKNIKTLNNKFITLLNYNKRVNNNCKIRYWLFFENKNVENNILNLFYNYCLNENNSINKIYVKFDFLNKELYDGNPYNDILINSTSNSINYEYVKYGSEKHLFYFFMSEVLITSQIRNFIYHPLFGNETDVINAIKQYNIIYIPSLSDKEHLNKDLIDNNILGNVSIWVVASEKEKAIIKNKYRHYDINDSILKVHKFPFYNSPVNQNERIILIKPDYRHNLYKGIYTYNKEFINSEYYKAINNLLNNKKLLSAIREYDYKIYFSPHEKIYCQIFDFVLNDSIIVIENNDITNKFLTECSLCITDNYIIDEYLFLRKPIIYYNFNDDNYTMFKNIYLDNYNFGEFATSNTIVDIIICYIKDECKMPPKFKENVNMYFNIKQNNSYKRLYDEIINLR